MADEEWLAGGWSLCDATRGVVQTRARDFCRLSELQKYALQSYQYLVAWYLAGNNQAAGHLPQCTSLKRCDWSQLVSKACAGQSPPISEEAAPTVGIERGGVDAVDSVLPLVDASEPVSIDAILPTKHEV